jgi:hypothetical protein
MQNKKDTESFGRRSFIQTVVYSGAGAIMVPSIISCGGSNGKSVNNKNNLLANGDFELIDPANSYKPAGWEVGPQTPGKSVTLTGDVVQSGSKAALQRRTVTEDYYYYLRQGVNLKPGALYRLRFYARADEKSSDLFAVCISGKGPEGPAWFYHPVHLNPGSWQPVDIVFRAQSGFNPLDFANIEFRLNQWRPDFSYRPNRPKDREVKQELHIDAASLVEIEEGTRVPGHLSRWLLVPGHDDLRMVNVELGQGDGVSMIPGSVRLQRNGRRMKQAEYLEEVSGSQQFAYSERSRRLYVHADEIPGNFDFSYEAAIDRSGDALLGISTLTGRSLRNGSDERKKIPIHFEKKEFDRNNWPVTQGFPFPEGELADLSQLRLLDPGGNEILLQVRATSYWADDSVRWVLLDFCMDAPTGETPSYSVEYGPGVKRSEVHEPIIITENDDSIEVDSGRLQFKVSRDKFQLLENLVVDGRKPLDGPAMMTVQDDKGRAYHCSAIKPYSVSIEEAGSMRAVIAVLGWNANASDGKFLTYTTRIHVYRNQPFVRVFHTLTNRHEEQVTGRHKWARGWPDESALQIKELPQRNVADASILFKPAGMEEWSFLTKGDVLSGDVGSGAAVHRQTHHMEGVLSMPSGKVNTGEVPGIIHIKGAEASMTFALFRYSNLFPKETRISHKGIELGLVPCTIQKPHALLKGTARTTELFVAFDTRGDDSGKLSARCFTEPSLFINQVWYCKSRGFMGDQLIPVNKYTIGTYDRIMESYIDNSIEPYPKGVDDCGLVNYGDFTYSGYNVWVNLEYDSDLGLYMYFARSGDRRAFLRAMDASRHFLDSDTGWYTGNYETHGANFPHNSVHYSPSRPGGHIYTLGLIHYYLLTGNRRALEATRLASDCVNRTLYHRIHQYASAFSQEDPVGTKRSFRIPGGPKRTPNSRNTSDPARYSLHSYLVTGEARFLNTSLSLAESLVFDWPEVWRGDDDQYIHYRWPHVIGKLYDLTGAEHFRKILVKCGEWILENPYRKYGEFRVSQGYGRGAQLSGTNNTRMMFLTEYAWKITGNRKYLDWMINMWDYLIEQDRHKEISRTDGKTLGKEADNPARGAAWVVPNRTVLIDHSPSRFQLVPPGKGKWKLTVGNTSETPLMGKLTIGPLPEGMEMETTWNFNLDLNEEKTRVFPVHFTEKIPDGRVTVPYHIVTKGTDGREGERNSFFAAHLLTPRTTDIPELTFHAPLDDDSPAFSYGGNSSPVFERKDFVEGRIGKALGEGAEGWSFNVSGSIFPDAGTFSVWLKLSNTRDKAYLRILGHAWPFIGIYSNGIVVCNQPYNYAFAERIAEWVHIAMRWDLRELAYFIDGEKVYQAKRENYEIPTGELWGLSQGSSAFDEIRIYSIPLENEKILSLAKS